MGSAAIEQFIHGYAVKYSSGDVDAVVDLCGWPFLAIRQGEAIHLADRNAVHNHFAAMIDAYAAAGYASFAPVDIDTRALGDASAFTTVRWHAKDAAGAVVRDTETTYHLLRAPSGWRMFSYTNHF